MTKKLQATKLDVLPRYKTSNNLFVSLAGGGVWLSGVLHSLAGVVHEFHRFLCRGRSAKMAAPPLDGGNGDAMLRMLAYHKCVD